MKAIYRPSLRFPELEEATHDLLGLFRGHIEEIDSFLPSFKDHLWQAPRIRGALHASHGRCCAYCQGTLTQSDRGDVEHFRPKSIYWWLAYSFENFLLSCGRCNRVRKNKRFPLEEGEPGLRFDDARTVGDEARLLLDPCSDDVESIALKLKRTYWSLVARRNEHGEPDRRAAETIDFFELNLGDHPRDRQETLAKVIELADKVRQGKEPTLKLKMAASRFVPYGGFIRRILGSGGFGDLLPSPAEEVQIYLARQLAELERYDELLEDRPGHSDTERLREQALWTTAILWYAPPAPVKPDEVGAWIHEPYRSEAAAIVEQLVEWGSTP